LPPVAGDGLRQSALGRSITCRCRRAMTFSPPMVGFSCPPTDLLRGLADDMSCLRALLPDAGC
jgi:hypothetical protein